MIHRALWTSEHKRHPAIRALPRLLLVDLAKIHQQEPTFRTSTYVLVEFPLSFSTCRFPRYASPENFSTTLHQSQYLSDLSRIFCELPFPAPLFLRPHFIWVPLFPPFLLCRLLRSLTDHTPAVKRIPFNSVTVAAWLADVRTETHFFPLATDYCSNVRHKKFSDHLKIFRIKSVRTRPCR